MMYGVLGENISGDDGERCIFVACTVAARFCGGRVIEICR